MNDYISYQELPALMGIVCYIYYTVLRTQYKAKANEWVLCNLFDLFETCCGNIRVAKV